MKPLSTILFALCVAIAAHAASLVGSLGDAVGNTTSVERPNAGTFTNPIKAVSGSDPFMVYDKGYYYLMTTTWSDLQLSRATTIAGLKTATPKVIYKDSDPSRCCSFWAPEMHWMPDQNSWYIYYSAGRGDVSYQRIHVVKGSSTSLWDSTWSYAGRLAVPNFDTIWSIDGTVLVVGSKRYLVYSGGNDSGQRLIIAPMTNPTTVGNGAVISTPTYSWEKETWSVNEGPAPLYHGNRTFISFSASHCTGYGYKLGRLDLTTGADPMNPSSWTKFPSPIFTGANGNYQPGHNGFFQSPSGAETWNVFHADKSAPSACDEKRYTMVQRVDWRTDGTPNLGSPLPLSQSIPEPV